MTHVINYYSKDFDVLYAVIVYILDVYGNLVYVVLNQEIYFFGTFVLSKCFAFIYCSSFQCMSMLNTSRRIYQQLVLLSLLFVVLSVIIVFVKLINVVFHVEIIIIIIVIRKHLFVLILYFSMCCHYYIRSKKKENKT